MAMMEVIVFASTNLFRIYLIHKFIQIFLGDVKQDKNIEILIGSIFFFVNTGSYLLFRSAWLNALCSLLVIGLMVFQYTKSLKTNLFVTSVIYLINMACNTIAVLFTNYNYKQKASLIYHIITVFLILICELFLEKIVSRRKNMDTVESFPFVLIPLSSMTLFIFVLYRKKEPDHELLMISLSLTLINFIVFYLYHRLSKAFTRKYKNELLAQRVQIYSNQLYTMLESDAQVKNLRHDMKHHLNALKLLASKNDLRSLQDYLDDMGNSIENPDEIVSSGNIEIDSVLNYLLQMAKRELCTVELKIQLPEALAYSFDINIILGNLLENAIEAARQTAEKYLSVTILFKKGILKIEMVNSFNDSLLFQKNEKNQKLSFVTTKKNKRKHGIGLNSVRKIVEKYNGLMEIDSENHRFYIKLVLYMPKTENKQRD